MAVQKNEKLFFSSQSLSLFQSEHPFVVIFVSHLIQVSIDLCARKTKLVANGGWWLNQRQTAEPKWKYGGVCSVACCLGTESSESQFIQLWISFLSHSYEMMKRLITELTRGLKLVQVHLHQCIEHIMKMSRTKFKFKVTVLRQSWVRSGEDTPHLSHLARKPKNSSCLNKPGTNPIPLNNRESRFNLPAQNGTKRNQSYWRLRCGFQSVMNG